MKATALTALVLILPTALSGCASAALRGPQGQVTSSATTDAFTVAVGDCLAGLETGEVSSITLIPCSQEHLWEAFASTALADDTYPGDQQLAERAEEFCASAFKEFVGVSRSKSSLELTFLRPTKQSWNSGNDREVLCLVGDPSGGTGTLKDADR